MPKLEILSMTVDVVCWRQTGVARTVIEDELVKRGISRIEARQTINKVDHQLLEIKRKQGLPLGMSAEGLNLDCFETQSEHLGKERRN